jgi:glycosyltransferase involved in cell wall biosynthesis
MSKPVVLIVIPAFNEADRLPRYLDQLLPELGKLDQLEIRCVVVDDGSGPGQLDRFEGDLEKRRKPFPLLLPLIQLSKNRGKGGAILAGWNETGPADFYSFLDADGAVPPSEVARLILQAVACSPPRSLFASRIRLLGKRVERKLTRHLLGRIFATLIGTFICREVYDSQCGFKLIPAGHWNCIRKGVQENRFAFDVELLAALLQNSLQVEEIPICWIDVPGSKISLIKDPWNMVCSVLKIRGKMNRGYYRR